MRRLTMLCALLALILVPMPASADDGGGYFAPGDQNCQSTRGEYSPGKTVAGFEATASDGCMTRSWTGSIGQGPGSGTVTFTTTNKVNPWEGDLPSMAGGPEAYCRARAAHEANLYWILNLNRPGVEVTVRYSCD